MRLAILSRSRSIYSTRRLVDAARARGHQVRVVDPLEVQMVLGGEAPALFYRDRPFPRCDAVIPRIGLSISQYGLAVVNQLGLLGVPVLNSALAIAATRNKMRCLQLLAASGVKVPPTVMASNPARLREMVKRVGGLPVLVKLISTNEKTGVMVCETLESLESALEAIVRLGKNTLVQQYLRGARGRDLRVLVVGGRVVAAVRRRARAGRMARKLALGAKFEPAELPAAYTRAAVEAARIVGLEVCGVDMLETRAGPRVFEVNSSPGLREAEEACGCDVAGAIVERAAALASGSAPPEREAAVRRAAP